MFNDSDRRNILTGSLGILLLVLICVGSIAAYERSVPVNVDHNTINISQQDYDSALAKWQARGATQYEVTLAQENDQVSLRITDDGSGSPAIEVLEQLHDGKPISSDAQVAPGFERLRETTVTDLFAQAKHALDAQTNTRLAPPSDGKHDFFYDYTVRFDPSLGYPTYLASSRRTTTPKREVVWRDELLTPLEVKGLKVLK